MDKCWTWLLWLAVLLLSGCGPRESGQASAATAVAQPTVSGQPLAFTTVVQDSVIGSYRNVAAPEIFVIANAQEAQDISRQILGAVPRRPRISC